MKRAWMAALAVAISTAATFSAPAVAQTSAASALLPLEHFTQRPKMSALRFSPSGTRFAALEEFKGRMNVVVVDLATNTLYRTTQVTDYDVQSFSWISDKRLVFGLVDFRKGLGDQDGGGLFAVDFDGTGGRELTPVAADCEGRCRGSSYWGRVKGSEDEIFALNNDRSLDSPDLIRLNTRTGRKSVVTWENPGRVSGWVLDANEVPRAAVSADGEDLSYTVWFRPDDKTPWRKLATYKQTEPGFTPLAFAPDGTLYVSSNLETGDKQAIHKYDPVANKLGEKIAVHPRVDITPGDSPETFGPPGIPLVFDKDGALVGISVEGEKPETVWFREREAKLQATIDASLPKGNVNTIRLLPENRALIFSRSGSDPGTYYLFDEPKKQLRELSRPRAWIKPQQMGAVQTIRYKARDGMEIPAYLTLPAGKEAKGLPLVAWIHGGPWARDSYGWDPEVQFLASRGYAVLQPNYRGSEGFGQKHLKAGFKQLGQTMQDDITDGIKSLIDQGIVDKDRVCIGGHSYGGYATMMGLIREPQMFRCGINGMGVTDLFWWIDLGYTDFNLIDPDAAEAYLKVAIGDPSRDRAMMEASSPRMNAAKVQAPVLFLHGGSDRRVPIKHAEAMRDALKAANKPYEWLVFPEEGHGFMKESNRIAQFKAMEAFLAKHIGPKP